MFQNENFDALSDPTFKLMLFSSFASAAVPLMKPLKALDAWRTSHQMTNFEYNLRINEAHGAYWDEAYIRAHVPTDATCIYIAGGKVFTESIFHALLACGFKKELITLL